MPDSQESEELFSDSPEPCDGDDPQEDVEVTQAHRTTYETEACGHHGARGVLFNTPPWRERLEQHCPSCVRFIGKLKELWLVQEMVKIAKLAVPIFLMFFFQQLLFFISLLLVGHSSGHSKTELDAAALASSVVNVTGISVVVGLTSAADTLCPQAYGFGNYRKVGIILQRGILISALVCLPIIALWLNTESILLLLHQPPCVARLTGEFVQIVILALPPFVVYIMMQKYLQAQSLVGVFVLIAILQNVINIIFASLFVYGADQPIVGTALSFVISYAAAPVILIAYIWLRGLHKRTWKGWSWESMTEWGLFLKLGVPGLFMICFEWWTYEISAIVAGTVSELQLAVNTVLMQFGVLTFAIPIGVGTAASVRIGNELGAGNPLGAKRATYAALVCQGVCAVFIFIVFASTRTFIAGIFTSEQDVIEETAKAMIPGTIVFFFDQFQGTFAGILRGCGRQKLGAVMNFVFYYMIGLPMGTSLAVLTDLGTTGMWTGLCVAVFLTDMTYVVIILTSNWTKISQVAMKNAADHETSPTTSTEIDESGESVTESSMVAMETDLNGGPPLVSEDHSPTSALTQAYKEGEEKGEDESLYDDDITSVEALSIEDAPLISFEDGEHFDSKTHQPPRSLFRERSDLFRKNLRLFLSKGLLYVIGLVLVVVGCGLAMAFRHIEVTEMCTLPEDSGNFSSSFVVHSSTSSLDQLLTSTYSLVPSPTTALIEIQSSVVSSL